MNNSLDYAVRVTAFLAALASIEALADQCVGWDGAKYATGSVECIPGYLPPGVPFEPEQTDPATPQRDSSGAPQKELLRHLDGIIVEPDARFTDVSAQQIRFMKMKIFFDGYKCDSISSARPCFWGCDLVMSCNEFRYSYEFTDRGGKWQMKVK